MTDATEVEKWIILHGELVREHDGPLVWSADYDALAAKLAEADERIAWLDCGFEQAMADTRAAEAKLAEVTEDRDDALIALASARKQLERYIGDAEATRLMLGAQKRMRAAQARAEAAEAALPAVYRLAWEDAYQEHPFNAPTPTAVELMARINAPKPRSSDACDFCGYNVQKPCKTKVDRQNCEFAP